MLGLYAFMTRTRGHMPQLVPMLGFDPYPDVHHGLDETSTVKSWNVLEDRRVVQPWRSAEYLETRSRMDVHHCTSN